MTKISAAQGEMVTALHVQPSLCSCPPFTSPPPSSPPSPFPHPHNTPGGNNNLFELTLMQLRGLCGLVCPGARRGSALLRLLRNKAFRRHTHIHNDVTPSCITLSPLSLARSLTSAKMGVDVAPRYTTLSRTLSLSRARALSLSFTCATKRFDVEPKLPPRLKRFLASCATKLLRFDSSYAPGPGWLARAFAASNLRCTRVSVCLRCTRVSALSLHQTRGATESVCLFWV